MCRGIWLFAVKAPGTVFRVESRIGQSVAYQTVYQALREMAKQKKQDLQAAMAAGRHFIVVSDNIQAYARQRDHRIGRENRMITGLAGTAVEMEDYDPQAFDMNDLIQRQKQQERKKLTTDLILADIDAQHLENVAVVHFLHCLLNFVPALSPYRQKLREYVASVVSKNQIPKTRRTNVTPLATNSANEMITQGMKEGILDFASTQMGMNKETLNNMASIWSGDGKTFNMLLSLKKMSAMESDDFHSFRWMIPLLELWHTKWTDMSRIVRTHWGSSDEPNSLATIAGLAECPTPSDMRKVDFYDGAHLINLALDAHLLVCWELSGLTLHIG
jgi:hypothetical protein